MGSGDFGTDDEDYNEEEYYTIDYGNEDDYYSVNPEPVIDNGIDTNGNNNDFEGGSVTISDLVIRITLLMKSPWNENLGMLCKM